MKYSTIRAAAVITALLLWAVCASARQQNVRSISGTVIDAATEKPIEFATVALIAPDSTIVNGTTTDSAGHFTIERIPSGEYKLMAAFIGYTSLITDLNAVPARGAVLALAHLQIGCLVLSQLTAYSLHCFLLCLMRTV